MNKIVILLVIGFMTGATIAAPKKRFVSDLEKLLVIHQSEMKAFFAGMQNAENTLPVFFCDVSFTGEKQVESFLRNVSGSSNSGQLYSQVSFTKIVAIGGNMRSVSFSLTNNGGNVTFVRSSNINGHMLKAVYEYDAHSKKLKTGAFDGKRIIKNSEYSI